MKKMKILILFLFVIATKSFALPYELYFYIHDGTDFVPMEIKVYHNRQLYASGWTSTTDDYHQYGPANGAGQIDPHLDNAGTFASITPRSGTWIFVFGVKSFSINLDNYQSGDLYIDYNVITHACSISVVAAPGPSYSGPDDALDKYEIMLTNDFAVTSSGSGNFIYDGSTVSNLSYKRAFLYSTYSQFPHTVSAKSGLDQIYPNNASGFPRMYNNWTGYANTTEFSFSIPSPTDAQAQANFNPGYKATFKNSYGSSCTNGMIHLDTRTYNSPADTAIRQGYPINATAVSQNKSVAGTNNYIALTSDHWSTGSTNSSITVTPGLNNQTYYCYLNGKPVHADRNLRFNDTSYGSYVSLTWNAFDDPDITGYQVWRRVKHNGVLGDPVLKTTISGRYTTSYTDRDYVVTQSYVDLLMYDVRAIYDPSSNNGWDQPAVATDPNFATVYGQQSLLSIINNTQEASALAKEILDEYSISNYPNPFNPTTTIEYHIPVASEVTIKLYDILGKEIAVLLNEKKEAGYYRITLNAGKLTSGIYILTINAGKFMQSKKIMLTK
ncbi:MAG: T9SS type A sorting domain-containing protein [Bacteroidetes bacterium]|nr:T9SS type A sorting domain-containing protein [Bacteroidota bacterium]